MCNHHRATQLKQPPLTAVISNSTFYSYSVVTAGSPWLSSESRSPRGPPAGRSPWPWHPPPLPRGWKLVQHGHWQFIPFGPMFQGKFAFNNSKNTKSRYDSVLVLFFIDNDAGKDWSLDSQKRARFCWKHTSVTIAYLRLPQATRWFAIVLGHRDHDGLWSLPVPKCSDLVWPGSAGLGAISSSENILRVARNYQKMHWEMWNMSAFWMWNLSDGGHLFYFQHCMITDTEALAYPIRRHTAKLSMHLGG